MENLTLLGFLVGEHHVSVNGRVILAVRVEDLCGREDRVEAEGTGFVRNDRDEVTANLLVLEEVLEQANECHGCCDLEWAGALRQTLERLGRQRW